MSRSTIQRVARALGAQLRSALERALRREIGRAVGHMRARLSGGSPRAVEPAGPARAAVVDAVSAAAPTGEPDAPIRDEPALIELNSASREELMSLPGIGKARAEAIVSGRPYGAEEDLVERGILPEGVFDGIEGAVCVEARGEAAGRPAGLAGEGAALR